MRVLSLLATCQLHELRWRTRCSQRRIRELSSIVVVIVVFNLFLFQFCLSCRFPKNVRKCAKSAFLVNHSLKSGKRPEFPFINEEKAERETQAQINCLLGSALEMREVVSSLSRDLNRKKDSNEKQSLI